MKIFIEIVLPIIIVFSCGYLLQKKQKLNLRSVSTLAIYILTPSLVFRTFYTAKLDLNYLWVTIFAFFLLFAIIIINKVYARIRKYPKDIESGLILSTAFMNAGNYGTPIILFAYGQAGFEYSVSFLVVESIIINIFGIYYAARGENGFKMALKSVSKMPLTYALLLALALKLFHFELPTNIFSAVDLVSQATIPVVMLILGMQLADLNLGKLEWDKIIYGVTVRMILSPLLAVIFFLLVPVDPLLQKVLIVSTAMPTAATTSMYALQFNSVPQLVSSITLVTTLVSIVTISFLLTILG